MLALGVAMIAFAQTSVEPSADWINIAKDAAFPFDGARYPNFDVHDPSIVKFGDTYVMVTTSGHEMAPISTSKDLMAWKTHGPIFTSQPDWLQKEIPGHRSIWAPAPIKVGTALRIYYCASARFGQNTSYIGYAECKNFNPEKPLEGWKDHGLLVSSKAEESNFNAIDPDVLIGPDGRHWMVYGSYWSGMYQVELDPETGNLKDPKAPHRHVASNSERGNPLEAPAMFFRDGYYYLGVTYGLAAQGIRSTYRMVVGRSKSPDGPFLGPDGKPMTDGGHAALLKSSNPMFGPGGGNYFWDGSTLYMAYHYYDGRKFWRGDLWGAPTLQIREVLWSQDGWPLPGLPVGANPPQSSTIEGTWDFQIDFGNVQQLTIKSDKTVQLERQTGTWEIDGSQLKIKWPNSASSETPWVDTLVIHPSNSYLVGRNQTGTVIRALKK